MMKNNDSKSNTSQTYILIGVSFLILACIFFAFAFMQPRVSYDYAVNNNFTTVDNSNYSSANNQSSTAYTTNYSNESVTETINNSSNVYTTNYNDTTGSATTNTNVTFPININTCSASDLTAIDGIGDAKAQAIVAYREQIGKYTSVEQIKNISGIGDATYAKISPYLTV